MTLEEAATRLREVCRLLSGYDRSVADPGLGELPGAGSDGVGKIPAWKLNDLLYEKKCLAYMLAPWHFRSGWSGKWHRWGGCRVAPHAEGAICRQARELSYIMYPGIPPPGVAVPPEHRRKYDRGEGTREG